MKLRRFLFMKKIFFTLAISLITLLISCSGTQYRDVNEDEGSRQWGPKEIKNTVDKIVGSLYLYLKEDWKKEALIEVKKIRNRTSEHIDTKILANEIVNNLLKKRIQFIDQSFSQEALAEMEKGMTGMVDSQYAIPIGELQSPNIYLYGEISDNVRYTGGERIQYLVVTFRLKSLRTGRLLWQEQKEFLKASDSDPISF